MTKERDTALDFVAGLFILVMIFYHCLQWSRLENSSIYTIIKPFFFFMPWFFFKGGVFHKFAPPAIFLKKNIKRLLIPFIKWGLIGYSCHLLFLYFQNRLNIQQILFTPFKDVLKTGSINGNPPLWFLTTLFVVRELFSLTNGNKYWVSLLGTASISISYLLYLFNIHEPLYLATINSGLFFYSIGYLSKQIQSKKIIFLFFTVYLTLSLASIPLVDMRLNRPISGNYLLWPIWAISGCFSINFIVTKIYKNQNFSSSKIIYFISYLGKNSMIYFVAHWPIIILSTLLFRDLLGWTDLTLFCALVSTESVFVLSIMLLEKSKKYSS